MIVSFPGGLPARHRPPTFFCTILVCQLHGFPYPGYCWDCFGPARTGPASGQNIPAASRDSRPPPGFGDLKFMFGMILSRIRLQRSSRTESTGSVHSFFSSASFFPLVAGYPLAQEAFLAMRLAFSMSTRIWSHVLLDLLIILSWIFSLLERSA